MPSAISNLNNVVSVCAGRAIPIVAHSTMTAHALVAQLSLGDALTIRFIDALRSDAGFSYIMAPTLWKHPEGQVARQGAAGCYHLDYPAACAGGHGGGDFGFRNYRESSRRAVKGDPGRAGQIGPQNPDSRSHLAGGGRCFHKRAQTYGQAEDCAAAAAWQGAVLYG